MASANSHAVLAASSSAITWWMRSVRSGCLPSSRSHCAAASANARLAARYTTGSGASPADRKSCAPLRSVAVICRQQREEKRREEKSVSVRVDAMQGRVLP